MRHYIVLTILFFTNNLLAQESILTFDKYNSSYNYDWRGFTTNVNHTKLANTFIEWLAESGEHLTIPYELKIDNRDLINKLNFVDINADGKFDAIYSGPSGGEPNIVMIFMFTNSKYKLALSLMQGIVKVNWQNNRVTSLLTHDWGCCAENRLISSEYMVEYSDDGMPIFNKTLDIVEIRRMTKPKMILQRPIEFVTQNNNYKIRLSPIIDDTTYLGFITENERLGNMLGTLEKGTKGKAYASETDETGRVWWYVAIKTDYPLNDSVLYMKDLARNSYYVGWISSRFVTKLNE